jgi:hypothetical protein
MFQVTCHTQNGLVQKPFYQATADKATDSNEQG